MRISPRTDPFVTLDAEPAYFVFTTRDEVYTEVALRTFRFERMGLAVGAKRIHGDHGLYSAGNLVGYLFLDKARLLGFVASYTSKAKQIPCEFFEWGMA